MKPSVLIDPNVCWLTMVPGVKFTDLNLMTGLAEYRNGGHFFKRSLIMRGVGLFVDMGVITPREQILPGREYDAGSTLHSHVTATPFIVQARSWSWSGEHSLCVCWTSSAGFPLIFFTCCMFFVTAHRTPTGRSRETWHDRRAAAACQDFARRYSTQHTIGFTDNQ